MSDIANPAQVPAGALKDPKVRQLVEDLGRLSERAEQLIREERQASVELDRAPGHDVTATAAALRSGADDPGNVFAGRAKDAYDNAVRRRKAAIQAEITVSSELAEHVRTNLDQLRAGAEKDAAKAAADVLKAVDALGDAVGRVAQARDLDRWLTQTARREFRAIPDAVADPRVTVSNRADLSSARVPVSEVLEALRRFAEPERQARAEQGTNRIRPGQPQMVPVEQFTGQVVPAEDQKLPTDV